MAHRVPIAERFWPKVDKRGPDECWPWQGFRDSDGYGRISSREIKSNSAHRASWFLANGVAPAGLVCHSCDNPPCVNPAHLWVGTTADNTHDSIVKGRARCVKERLATHCKRGHEFTPENTYTGQGWRACRKCRNACSVRHRSRARREAALRGCRPT